VFKAIKLESTAAFFEVEDATGGVWALRACVKAASAIADPSGELLKLAAYKTPFIVHSTVLRFARPPRDGISEADIRARFDSVAATWRPVTVLADRMIAVCEKVPFMHLELAGKDAAQIVGSFPIPAGPS
jgi:hypothetical protein